MSSGGRRWDLNGPTRWVYETAGIDPSEPPRAPRLVERILGNGAIDRIYGTEMGGAKARLIWLPQMHEQGWCGDTAQWHIQIRRRLPLKVYFWLLLHELAEYILKLIFPYDGEDRELFANALAASLWMPLESMRPFLRGPLDLSGAEEFDVDPACYALRWAELTGASVALVSPGHVYRRGPGWPSESQVRRMARGDDPPPPLSGVRPIWRHELPRTEGQNERRVLLVAGDEGAGDLMPRFGT